MKRSLSKKKMSKQSRKSIRLKKTTKSLRKSGICINFKNVRVAVPAPVKSAAERAFVLRKMGFQGGMDAGWNRAKQLAHSPTVSLYDLKVMRAWFARHDYTSKPTYDAWIKAGLPKTKEWHTRRGIIAYLIWGGPAAQRWVHSQKVTKLLENF